MKNFILKKIPIIFFISLLDGIVSQMVVQLAGFDIKGLCLLIFLAVFTILGLICFGMDCGNESDKEK
jgi:hypothetical protein